MGSINSIMKVSLCHYSGYKIHPGHGKTMVRVDGKVYHFLDSKCERAHLIRGTHVTLLGLSSTDASTRRDRKRSRLRRRRGRPRNSNAPSFGASLTEILAKRNQKPE